MLIRFNEGEGLVRGTVTSATKLGERYFVDLNEHFGNGQCDCPDFRGRKYKELMKLPPKEGMVWTEKYRCKHILAMRQEGGDRLLSKHLEIKRRKEQGHAPAP